MNQALEAWRGGQEKPGRILGVSPTIEAVDSVWSEGKKLKQFEILQETTVEGRRQFTVKLTLDGAEPESVNYVVIGKDPLLVFRESDYEKMSGE